ncbi:DUF4936 family protein [Aquabacterium sp. OR-4]|uniref:DUF4936 family protein n=1 Tax=Aquabacterium sp. OR-4 TaxID=2978127 RepID=UPI0021B2AD5A|nr:DUF4936 family protein [Aquabacterium sp. OR-4]MDT7834665.1 DUF4936 family protein [Aquabacterium sp. OR-4]
MADQANTAGERLYVYYRVPEPALAGVLGRVRAMQAQLLRAHAGLSAELLRRPELRDGELTLMEAYAGLPGPGFEQALADAASAAGLPQPRHSERFTPLA